MDKCAEGKVPIYNKTRRHQTSTNSSSRLQIDDFQEYSQSAPGYHVSAYIFLMLSRNFNSIDNNVEIVKSNVKIGV
jgi:hypothetical protein